MAHDLPHILNWRRISPLLTTSGQPSEAELAQIAAQGVVTVINLGPHDNKGALDDEAGTLAALGMGYVYIPVDFEAPTQDDFERFCEAVARSSAQMVHVHCIYNARVSAFFYRHACEGHGDKDAAFARMDSIWRPGGVWARFIGEERCIDDPHLYAGEDY
jgi:uncharacterized protein (TIGR01244 family)